MCFFVKFLCRPVNRQRRVTDSYFFSPHPSAFSSEPHQQQQQQQQQNAISDRYVSIAISSEISQLNG